MRFRLSAVSAWVLRDLGVLDARLVDQIDRVHTKAGTCTFRAPIGELQKARDALEALIESDAAINRGVYRSVLEEVTSLADPGTSPTPEFDDGW